MRIHIYPPDGAPFEMSQEELVSLWNSGLIEQGCEYRIEGMRTTRPLEEFFMHLPPAPPASPEQAPALQASTASPDRPGIAMRRATMTHKRRQQWIVMMGVIVLLAVGSAIAIPAWQKHEARLLKEKIRKAESLAGEKKEAALKVIAGELDDAIAAESRMLPRKLSYGMSLDAVSWRMDGAKPLITLHCRHPYSSSREGSNLLAGAITTIALEDHYRSREDLMDFIRTYRKHGATVEVEAKSTDSIGVLNGMRLATDYWVKYPGISPSGQESEVQVRRVLEHIASRLSGNEYDPTRTVELLPGNILLDTHQRFQDTKEENPSLLYEEMQREMKTLAADPFVQFYINNRVTHRYVRITPNRRSKEFTYEITPERLATESANFSCGNPASIIPSNVSPTGTTLDLEELKAKLRPLAFRQITMEGSECVAILHLRNAWRDKMNLPAFEAACSHALKDFYQSEAMEPFRRLGVGLTCHYHDGEDRLITTVREHTGNPDTTAAWKRRTMEQLGMSAFPPELVDSILRRHAEEISISLPLVAGELRVDSVKGPGGGVMEYHTTYLTAPVDEIPNLAESRMSLKASLESPFFLSEKWLPEIALDRRQSVIFSINITDKAGKLLLRHDIKPAEIAARTAEEREKRASELIDEYVKDFRPWSLEEGARVNSLKLLPEKILEHSITLSPEVSDKMNASSMANMQKKMVRHYRTEKDMDFYRNHGFTMRYQIQDNRGRPLGTVNAGPEKK